MKIFVNTILELKFVATAEMGHVLNLDVNYMIENQYDFWILVIVLPSVLIFLLFVFLFMLLWVKIRSSYM